MLKETRHLDSKLPGRCFFHTPTSPLTNAESELSGLGLGLFQQVRTQYFLKGKEVGKQYFRENNCSEHPNSSRSDKFPQRNENTVHRTKLRGKKKSN